jgi:RNA polymerase sigma factor (sigma-70 family)
MNEQEAWIAFQNGDQDSLEKIYRVYYTPLYNYGFKWLRNVQLVEDSIQDLFIKLIRNKEKLAVPDSVRHYLFYSFRTVVLDKLKSQKQHVNLEETHFSAFELQLNPETELMGRQEDHSLQKKLQQSLEKLTPRQREAVFLRYFEGFSYLEVAAILDLSPKATYKLMARAIEALRQIMPLLLCMLLIYALLKEGRFQ